MTPPPIDQCMLFLSMIELFPETNNDWYRYKLQSSLTPLPSHNKREQYLGNQITRFRNAPWQCGGKKKTALTSNRSITPWFIYFSSLQPFFPLQFHILFLDFLLLLSCPIIKPTFVYTTRTLYSALRGRWRITDQDLRRTNTLPYNRPTVILCLPLEFFATHPLIWNNWYRKSANKKEIKRQKWPTTVSSPLWFSSSWSLSSPSSATLPTASSRTSPRVPVRKWRSAMWCSPRMGWRWEWRSWRMRIIGIGARGWFFLFPFFLWEREKKKDRGLQLSSVLVNMWNHTSFPAYKSRLWNMTGSTDDQDGAEKRKPWVFCPLLFIEIYILIQVFLIVMQGKFCGESSKITWCYAVDNGNISFIMHFSWLKFIPLDTWVQFS